MIQERQWFINLILQRLKIRSKQYKLNLMNLFRHGGGNRSYRSLLLLLLIKILNILDSLLAFWIIKVIKMINKNKRILN